jgi:hypothetical protein
MKFVNDEISLINRNAGGGTLTKVQRATTIRNAFEIFRKELNVQIKTMADLKISHVVKLVEHYKAAGKSTRTMQVYMSAIRTALRAHGRKLAVDERISNKALGIDGASRAGTKVALTAEGWESVQAKAAALGKQNFVAAIELQRTFGLRAREVIQSAQSLKSWEKVLMREQTRVGVLHGTKGGRGRDTPPVNLERGLAAIRACLLALDSSGRLIPSKSLEGAARSYQRDCVAVGLTGVNSSHCLRYGYAQELKALLLAQGNEAGEAKAGVSLALGHGDGRATYIDSVYAQK